MPCLAALLIVLFPRVALVLIYLLSTYLQRAYHTVLWPFLGFLFLPLTTLAYAWAVNSNGSVTGMYLVIVIIAAVSDLGLLGGSDRIRRR